MEHSFPILEFDPSTSAFIDPPKLAVDAPECVVGCFFQDVINGLVDDHGATVIHKLVTEVGEHPIYEIGYLGQRLAVLRPGLGCPLAAGLMEETIALGCRHFIACGGCGVLDSGIAMGHVLVPTSAVRDEGTSYHYLPPSREVTINPKAVDAIERVLTRREVEYLTVKTWTTDAIYRETHDRIRRRREEGCLTVEMECSAFAAVAQFRGVDFGQLLYGGDDLGGEVWDGRQWQGNVSAREKLFWLAAEACLEMA